jgi:hypothetical protein
VEVVPLAAEARPGRRAWARVGRSPWAVAGAVFLVYGLWLAAMFSKGYDARDSIVLGKNYVQMSHASSAIKVDPHFSYPVGGSGYDGQFFYFIAVDPINARYYMDSPSYRYTKILYPVVARVLALGQVGLVPYTLILTNWLAIAGAAGLLGAWLRRKGLSPWFAVVYALCPGIWVSFERDLTEPLSYALVVLAVYLYDSRSRYRFATSGLAFALAILARDKAAIFAGVYGLGILLRGLEAAVQSVWGSRGSRGGAFGMVGWSGPRRRSAELQTGAEVQRSAEIRGSDELRGDGRNGTRAVPYGAPASGSLQAGSYRDFMAIGLRNLVEAGIFGALALGPYLLWRLFVRHWLHVAASVAGVTGVSTSYESAPLSGVLSSGIGTTTRVMYLFVLFIPALICALMGVWALLRGVWAVPVITLLVLIELSVVGLGADYFVDVYGVLRVEAGVILAATFCLPYFGRLTRGNALWFYACSGGWLLLTMGYMLLAPAWLLAGRA